MGPLGRRRAALRLSWAYSAVLGRLVASWGRTVASCGRLGVIFGASWGRLGRVLRASWAVLGPL